MNAAERVIIYHLSRKDGTSLFLHPFSSPSKLISCLDRASIEGRYGREPKVENLSLFRDELYRMIERGVRNWMTDLRFIPNFLISSAVFVFSTLVFFIAVPDPVPFFDEFLFGGCAAAATFFFIRKKDMKSDPVLKKRVAYRTAIDRIIFLESPFIHTVESMLHATESGNEGNVLEALLDSSEPLFREPDKADVQRLLQCLEQRFDAKELRRQERTIRRLSRNRSHVRGTGVPGSKFVSKKLDLPLFVLYSRMKREFEYAG